MIPWPPDFGKDCLAYVLRGLCSQKQKSCPANGGLSRLSITVGVAVKIEKSNLLYIDDAAQIHTGFA